VAPRRVTRDQFAAAAREALGGGRRLAAVERLAGGTKKGVYRLTMDDATTVIAYLWDDSENYWPAAERDGDPGNPFSPSVGLDYYEAAHARLGSLGLRVPTVHLVDLDHSYYPADLAIVEDFPGEDLMDLFRRDPRAAEPTMKRLAEALEGMRDYRAPSYGKVALIDRGETSRGRSCEGAVLDFSLHNLAEAASRDQRIASARDRLEERLRELAAAVRPRTRSSTANSGWTTCWWTGPATLS
jgi:hypothetical protein